MIFNENERYICLLGNAALSKYFTGASTQSYEILTYENGHFCGPYRPGYLQRRYSFCELDSVEVYTQKRWNEIEKEDEEKHKFIEAAWEQVPVWDGRFC